MDNEVILSVEESEQKNSTADSADLSSSGIYSLDVTFTAILSPTAVLRAATRGSRAVTATTIRPITILLMIMTSAVTATEIQR